jgi:tripartite-type tricarboxylate transporter receptor subunit TctC
MNRIHLACRILAVLLVSIAGTCLAAEAYPTKPIRIIIPWAPGGGTDVTTRFIGAELDRQLKQRVLIDNRSGAGGIVGMQLAAQAPADGYTMMVTSTAYGYLLQKTDVDLVKSFDPVVMFGTSGAALVVNPSLPVKSVKELIALAKSRPGALNYASSGVGGFPHMNAELFRLMTGVDLVHVPFKGAGDAIPDVIAGNTQLLISSVPGLLPHINSGRLRVLGTGGLKRDPTLPNVPTISEAGVPGYETYIWFGMFAPKGTPADAIGKVHAATATVLKSPQILSKFEEQGITPVHMSSAEFGKLMITETAKWMKVIKAANIKTE